MHLRTINIEVTTYQPSENTPGAVVVELKVTFPLSSSAAAIEFNGELVDLVKKYLNREEAPDSA